ncbi:type II secretion system F family protein [Lacticaseibacillus mingshuiensis]|uniref:Type II secretion system F family protein n=1 Tax=Lacticaseibacillus mingshuiensis TaxID=2799574 RepID=A0ABW4CKB3_9LACO|nr:type II secretion system F family protein [Lacticaseibacillus mingshuiensis]
MKKAKRLSSSQQVQFASTLAQLLEAGFSLQTAISYLLIAMPQAAAVLNALQRALTGGVRFSQALTGQGFASPIVFQVTLAEGHGALSRALATSASLMQMQQMQRRHLAQQLVYPAVLLGLLAILQVALLAVALPLLELPVGPAAWWSIGLSGTMALAGGFGALGWRFVPAAARATLAMRVPVVRRMMTLFYQYQFMTGSQAYLLTGQQLTDYLAHLGAMPAGPLAKVGRQATVSLSGGATVAEVLHHPLIPQSLPALLALGLPREQVVNGIELLAAQQFARLQSGLAKAVAVVQPLLFLVIGSQIVLVYLTVLLPLYQQIGGMGT